MAAQSNEMYDLYFVVHLNGLRKNVCVPDFWCNSFDLAKQINEGLNRNVNHLIFYSPDLTKEPDFSLPVLNGQFDDANDHCYFGKVIRAFNTHAEATKYVERSRGFCPAVYSMHKSGGRTTNQTQLLSANEFNVAISTNYEKVNGRFNVKQEKFCDEISELRNRIVTAHDTSGINGLDDSDIEYLQNEIDNSDDDDDIDDVGVGVSGVSGSGGEADGIGKVDGGADSGDDNEPVVPQIVVANRKVADSTMNDTSSFGDDSNEADDFSGGIPFTPNDVNDRFYHEYDVVMREAIVKCLSAWNKSTPFSSILYDKRFIGVLLKEVFYNDLDADNLDVQKLRFMNEVFNIRVKGDTARASKFNSIVNEKHQNAKGRARSASTDTQ